MTSPTLLVEPAELDASHLVVAGQAYRHLFRARRTAAGERVRLADGAGRARWAEVVAVGRREARLVPGPAALANEPVVDLELLVAAPRPERAAWLVEKATEVGISAVRLLTCARSARPCTAPLLARLRRVARSAVEQSHRARVPAVTGPHPWSEVEGLLAGQGGRWVLDRGGLPAADALEGRGGAVLVGPEGGWSAEESSFLARLGCVAVSLGPRTLRVETAAVAASAIALVGRHQGGAEKRGVAAGPGGLEAPFDTPRSPD